MKVWQRDGHLFICWCFEIKQQWTNRYASVFKTLVGPHSSSWPFSHNLNKTYLQLLTILKCQLSHIPAIWSLLLKYVRAFGSATLFQSFIFLYTIRKDLSAQNGLLCWNHSFVLTLVPIWDERVFDHDFIQYCLRSLVCFMSHHCLYIYLMHKIVKELKYEFGTRKMFVFMPISHYHSY